jgi:hypothetical protein
MAGLTEAVVGEFKAECAARLVGAKVPGLVKWCLEFLKVVLKT